MRLSSARTLTLFLSLSLEDKYIKIILNGEHQELTREAPRGLRELPPVTARCAFPFGFAFARAFLFSFSERKLTQNAKLFFSPGTRRETELHANIEARKTFTQQATENEMVLEELKSLEEGASVYKLIGPMLAKQDVVEATSNVTKRLEFINAER